MEWENIGLTRVETYTIVEPNNNGKSEYKKMPLYVKVINGVVFFSLLIDEDYHVFSFTYEKVPCGGYNCREIERMSIFIELNDTIYYLQRPYLGELTKTCVDLVQRSHK